MATIKKPVKAQNGTPIKGNPKGYAKATSPLKTSPYEKKVTTVGNTVRRTDGSGKLISSAPKGSSRADQIKSQNTKDSTYTTQRRNLNKDFLESRENIGKVASKLQKGGTVKKSTIKKNIKDATKMKNMRPVMKSGGKMGKC